MFLLYIDPGTGSMLFSLFIGIAAAAVFGIRALLVKIKFLLSGGKKVESATKTKIPVVIFSDHKRYWNIFKPICDEADKLNVPINYYTASPDDPALHVEYKNIKAEFIGEGNKPYQKLNFLSANLVLATTPGLDVYQWKKSKNVNKYVHIPHTVDDLSGYRMFGLDFYDAVLTTGDNQKKLIQTIENLRPNIKKKELVNVGSPNLDVMLSKVKKSLKSENTRPIILVAPSWGKSGILSKYGDELLNALSSTEYKIIVRPHPQTIVSEQNILKPLMEKYSNIEWNTDNDNFDVLNKSDLLITDFSGIIFDYTLVFDKPLIYADTEFDTGPYDADWLDEPMWSLRKLPELGIKLDKSQFNNIDEVIKQALSDTKLKENRNKVRAECWTDCGNAAKNIVEYINNELSNY